MDNSWDSLEALYSMGLAMLTEQFFDANGISIHYAVGATSSHPLVLLHGITERWQTFLSLLSHLSNEWQIYALDLRGHGESGKITNRYRISDYAQDVICFGESQINQPMVILGHSIGALIAMYIAANRPELVKAIVLVDPPLHLQHTPLKDIPNGPYEAFKQIVEMIRANPSPSVIEQGLVKLFPSDHPETRQNRAQVLSQLDPEALNDYVEDQTLVGLNLDELLSQIECPTLLIQGNPKLGAALFDEDLKRALTLLRHGVQVSISEGSHMLHHSHPRALANAIKDFYTEEM